MPSHTAPFPSGLYLMPFIGSGELAKLSPVPVKVSLDATLGAAFLGHIVTILLYGITSLQAFMYYRRNNTDGSKLKLAVFVIWILDTFHAGLITGALYWYCITNFTNLLAVQRPIWPIPVRIYSSVNCARMSKSHESCLIGQTMIIVSNVSNSIVRLYVNLTDRVIRGHSLTSLRLGLAYAAYLDTGYGDAFLSAFIFVPSHCTLQPWGGHGLRVRRQRLLSHFSAFPCFSLCAIGALVSYAVSPTKFIYFAFYFVLSKLYVNSLLATLNARGSLLGDARRNARRRRVENKVLFHTTPTLSTEPSSSGSYDPSSDMGPGENIESNPSHPRPDYITGDTEGMEGIESNKLDQPYVYNKLHMLRREPPYYSSASTAYAIFE
ncbi:hypothetical protein BN946_scf185009.g3 [Trametes cinnabarina]|uniref:DUF6534 domain-containing protein n=1 Tax=Pycnoporus cinnabarinus TaxID=5643 RepID=A0A060S6P5_PYCCI|nr:hypothetical protein BN946_scf185009.g3 [Trametes cinnabarina]